MGKILSKTDVNSNLVPHLPTRCFILKVKRPCIKTSLFTITSEVVLGQGEGEGVGRGERKGLEEKGREKRKGKGKRTLSF